MIHPYQHYTPKLGKNAWVAPNATLIGDVELGEDVSLWFGAVVRGDVHSIRIGDRSNIQDNSVVHVTHHKGEARTDTDGQPTIIGHDVTVGHNVILHGCTIGNFCLIGMGAIIIDGADIGDECIIGAGAMVTKGKAIPPRSLVIGSPAKVVRELREEEIAELHAAPTRYVGFKNEYIKMNIGDMGA